MGNNDSYMASKSTSSKKKRVFVKMVTPSGAVGLVASEVPTVVLEGLLEKLLARTAKRMPNDTAILGDCRFRGH